MADILSIVLQAIGGQKLGKVGSVYAEGSNITRQLGGGVGIDSLMNKIPQLQSLMSSSGLAGVFTNPVGSSAAPLADTVTGAIPIVSALTSSSGSSSAGGSSGSGSTTSVPAYPLFTAALKATQPITDSFFNMSNLLSGVTTPDYNQDEYGLADVLDASQQGTTTLNQMVGPILINSVVSQAYTALQLLLTQVQSNGVTDANAVLQLQSIVKPLQDSMTTSRGAYNAATTVTAEQTALSLILAYVTNGNSTQSVLVQSLMDPNIASLVLTENQNQADAMNENRAEAKIQRRKQQELQRRIDTLLLDQPSETKNV